MARTRINKRLRRTKRRYQALLASSERERTRLVEAGRAKDDFLASLSHELRTPLNALLGWVQLLRTGGLDEASSCRALETIERNARAQAQLITKLLDASGVVAALHEG